LWLADLKPTLPPAIRAGKSVCDGAVSFASAGAGQPLPAVSCDDLLGNEQEQSAGSR